MKIAANILLTVLFVVLYGLCIYIAAWLAEWSLNILTRRQQHLQEQTGTAQLADDVATLAVMNPARGKMPEVNACMPTL